ncbi:MAG: right-handed parallel beta-helix repeat-containing protein, partial [Burkholderiaceae bacterium]
MFHLSFFHFRDISSNKFAQGAIAAAIALSCVFSATASAATLSVGPGKTYPKPCSAFAAAADGDTIEIDGSGAPYVGDVCAINANKLTIHGVNGRPKIDAGGVYALGKGIWVVVGTGTTIDNVEMYGAKVPDKNGAAIRLDGRDLTMRNSFLHDNEDGILTSNDGVSNIIIESSEFAHNGNGDGYSHNIYVGNVNSLVFRGNYSHDANVSHNLKSRAKTNTVVYNRFSSTPAGQAGAGQP